MSIVEKYDLTEKMAPFLDMQQLHQLLKHAEKVQSIPAADAKKADLQALSKTFLVDEIAAAGGDAAAAAAARDSKQKSVESESQLEQGRFAYDSGDYAKAIELLTAARSQPASAGPATWGKLAASIQAKDWAAAGEDLSKVQEVLDHKPNPDALAQLNARAWLIHWSLFVLFNGENGVERLSDTFFQSSYMSTIQASCPWILRYLTVAVLITNVPIGTAPNHRRIKDLVRVVSQELYEYQDPVSEVVKALYVDYDLDAAAGILKSAEELLAADPFVSGLALQFAKSVRFLLADLYCRVHTVVVFDRLATVLGLSASETETWITQLVKDGKINGEINESTKTLLIPAPRSSVLQQISHKTEKLAERNAHLLAQARAKHENAV